MYFEIEDIINFKIKNVKDFKNRRFQKYFYVQK